MKTDSNVRATPRHRRLLLPLLAALGFAGVPAAWADGPVDNRVAAASTQKPLPPGAPSDELIVMLCRRGLEPGQPAPQIPQELPLICLVTQTDEQTLQMGPARFQQLLDQALRAGTLTVLALRPN